MTLGLALSKRSKGDLVPAAQLYTHWTKADEGRFRPIKCGVCGAMVGHKICVVIREDGLIEGRCDTCRKEGSR